jgi:amidohydrolase family protein
VFLYNGCAGAVGYQWQIDASSSIASSFRASKTGPLRRCYRYQLQIAEGSKMKTLASGSVLLVLFSMFIAERAIAQQGMSAPPDTIFYNGKIITVDSAFTVQQAFAVRGDAYVAVGTDAAIRAFAGGNTRVVDLKGSAVIPGLSDNHDHLYNSEKVMRGIDLVGATSTAEVLSRLRDGLTKAKAGETVLGSVGWRAPLTKNDLDQLSTDVPIVALRGRRGAAVMNSAALILHGEGNPEGQQRGADWGAS